MSAESDPRRDQGFIRASDADRDRAVDRLRAALVEGRLAETEFTDRLTMALSARTIGDLDALTRDLPEHPPPPVGGPSPGSDSRPAPTRRANATLRAAWLTWATAVGINVVVWAMVAVGSAEVPYFWPMWVAGPWGIMLLIVTLTSGERPVRRRRG